MQKYGTKNSLPTMLLMTSYVCHNKGDAKFKGGINCNNKCICNCMMLKVFLEYNKPNTDKELCCRDGVQHFRYNIVIELKPLLPTPTKTDSDHA